MSQETYVENNRVTFPPRPPPRIKLMLLLNRWWDSGSNQGAQCVTAVGMKRHEMAPNRPETDKKHKKTHK